jgi:prepilin-type processing-associated H-X9-DG protein
MACASDRQAGRIWTSYGRLFALGNYMGQGAMLDTYGGTRFADCTDGASQTLFVGERGLLNDPSPYGCWSCAFHYAPWSGFHGDVLLGTASGFKPGSAEFDWDTAWATNFDSVNRFWSFHPGGANFVYVDGSVQFLSYDIDQETFHALSTRAGGEVVAGL